jgi:phage baseplate assembly protein W
MSIDVRLRRKCDHLTREDGAKVEDDRRTVLMNRPTSAPNEIRVMVNGIFVPRNGVIGSETHYSGGFFVEPWPGGATPDFMQVVFNRTLPAIDDKISLWFPTIRSNCRVCNGRGFLDDYNISVTGDYSYVRDEEKLIQDVRKILMTPKATNIFHRWYGSLLDVVIGGKAFGGPTEDLLTAETGTAIRNLIDLQDRQRLYQIVTDGESLASLENVSTQVHVSDPTIYEVEVVIQARSRNIGSLVFRTRDRRQTPFEDVNT